MKVRKVSASRKVLPPTPQVADIIQRVLHTPVGALPAVLSDSMFVPEWQLGRSDLHNWIPVLDRFDDLLATYQSHDSQVLLSILAFDRLLLENCSSRNLFNSYDNLSKMLAGHDMVVLESVLELLVLPARKLEAHRHLLKTYNECVDLRKLKLFSGLLLPEEVTPELASLQEVHRSFQEAPDPEGPHLHIKLMALFILLMLDTNTYDAAHSSVFSVNPLLIDQTIEIVAHADRYPQKAVASALYVLRACLKYDFKGRELSSGLQLNSSNGLFMSRLREINRCFVSGQLQHSAFYLTGFTDLLVRLCSTPSFDAELLNLGVLQEMITAFEQSQSKYYRFVEKYLYCLESMVSKLQGTMDVLIGAANGLHVLVRILGRLANMALLSDLESSFLSALLKLLEKILLCHGSDERLRNLVETPLFSHLRTIFKNDIKMTAEVLSRSMCVMSTFVHNEPNTLSIVQEAGVPTAFLSMLTLPGSIPKHSDFLSRLFTALSALCLNANGLGQVQEMNPFKSFFACFLDRNYSRHLLSHGTSTTLGQSIDEFIRHHPACKDQICDELISMLRALPDAMTAVAGECSSCDTLSPVPANSDDFGIVSFLSWEVEDAPSAILYEAVVSMLETLVQNPQHFEELKKRQFIPLVSRGLVMRLPFDFVASPSAHAASHLFRIITESPDNRILETLMDLFDECYVRLDASVLVSPVDASINQRLARVNEAFQALVALSNVMDLLCEVHINSVAGHMRTMAAWRTITSSRADTLMNIVSVALLMRQLYLDIQTNVPLLVQKTALQFRGRDWERPIGALLDYTKYPDDFPLVDPRDPRVLNTRKMATVEREVLDSIITLFSAISASASMLGHRTTPEEDSANQQLLLTTLQRFFERGLQDGQPFISLALFFVDCILYEDLGGKISLLATPLKPLVQCGDLFIGALSHGLPHVDFELTMSIFLSIAHSLVDYKSYRSNFWDELMQSGDRSLQGLFEIIAHCCILMTESSNAVYDRANFMQLLSLLVDPTWVGSDPTKLEIKQLGDFVSACKGHSSHSMVDPAACHWMLKFGKGDFTSVEGFVRQHVSENAMAASVILDASSVKLDGLTEHPRDQLIQVVLGMLYFNMRRATEPAQQATAANSILPSFLGLMNLDRSGLSDSAASAILLGLSLLTVAATDHLPFEALWLYARQFWSTDSLEVRHALLQLHVALAIKAEPMTYQQTAEFAEGNFPVLSRLVTTTDVDIKDVKLNGDSNQAIIHLLVIVLRLTLEKSDVPGTHIPYALDHVKAELALTFRREFLFEEIFSDRIQAAAILHPEAFARAFRGLFKVVDPPKKIASVEAYRHQLDRELRVKIVDAKPVMSEEINAHVSQLVSFLFQEVFKHDHYGHDYGYCALMLVICELSVHYPPVLSAFLKDVRFGDLMSFLIEHLTPASSYEIPSMANDPRYASRVLELKEKMINRAWCQYYMGACLSGCWRNEHLLASTIKSMIGALVCGLKKCQSSPDSLPAIYGLVDTLYHLLTFGVSSSSNLEDQASRQIISKLVTAMVESKVALLLSLLLRGMHVSRDPMALQWRELVRGKVVRFMELMTRYGNRLKRVVFSKDSNDTGEEEDLTTDDDGYESYDEEDDLPSLNEEEEMMAQVESAQDELMSEGSEEGDMFMSMDDDEDAMDLGDDGEDASSSTLDEASHEGQEDEMYDAIEEDEDEEDMIIDGEEDMEDDGQDDVEYEIEIEPVSRRGRSLGRATYHLSPEDLDLRGETTSGHPISRFIARLLDATGRSGDGDLSLDAEEYDATGGEVQRQRSHSQTATDAEDELEDDDGEANELEALAGGRDVSPNEQDDGVEETDDIDLEDGGSEFHFSEEPHTREHDMPLSRRRRIPQGTGSEQFFAQLQAQSQTGGNYRRMLEAPSYASALSGPSVLPLHPLLSVPSTVQLSQQNYVTPIGRARKPAEMGCLAALITPISVGTGKRWQQAVNLFRLPVLTQFKEDLRSQLVAEACAAFKPAATKDEEKGVQEAEEETWSTTDEADSATEGEEDQRVEQDGASSNESAYVRGNDHEVELETALNVNLQSQQEEHAQTNGEIVYEDPGADVEFLTALPFEMRTEVLEQHFEQRRQQLPPNTTRIVISSRFLQALPEDLRDDYRRLSGEDFLRFQRSQLVRAPHSLQTVEEGLANLDPTLRQLFDLVMGRMPRPSSSVRASTASSTPLSNGQPNPSTAINAPNSSNNAQLSSGQTRQEATAGVSMPEDANEAQKAALEEEGPAIVDTASLLTLLQHFVYEPALIKDRRTSFRLFGNLCSNGKTRADLLNMLLVILEKCPYDDSELSALFDTFAAAKLQPIGSPVLRLSVPSRPASVSPIFGSAPMPSDKPSDERVLKRLVIVQRTLQLLMFLVNQSSTVADFFVRDDQDIHTTALSPVSSSVPSSSTPSNHARRKRTSRLPLVLLFTALENGFVSGQPLLTEHLMHLIALIVKTQKDSTSVMDIPSVFLHILVKSLQTASFSVKGALYSSQCFTLLSRQSPALASSLLTELSEAVQRTLRSAVFSEHDTVSSNVNDIDGIDKNREILSRLLRTFKILGGIAMELARRPEDESRDLVNKVSASLDLTAFARWLEGRHLSASTSSGNNNDESAQMAVEIYFLQEKTIAALTNQAALSEHIVAFSEKHRQLVNGLIHAQPPLLLGSLSRLSVLPHLLEFENKRIFFKSQLHKRTQEREQHLATLNINIRRVHVFEDSFHAVMAKTGEDFRYARLNVKFHGEEGVDAGGVTREWFSVLSRAMFNPDYVLFKTSAGDKITYQPNRLSFVNPDHLSYFRFIGRVIAKAINDNRLLDCYFTRAFYKQILGRPLDLSDLEAVDPDFYKSMHWVLDNDISNGVLGELTFSVEVEDFGEKTVVDLKADGRNILVSEDNKREYVQLVSEYKLHGALAPQMDAFLRGFFEIIPRDLIAIFDEQELELLISGLPDIDVDDWKNNTEYHNAYTVASPQIQWFWRCVRAMTLEERAKLIQFVTGTSKVPLEGFAHLQGSNGRQRFQIHRDCGGKHRLPSAHTCFNQLDLPEYDSYEQLRDALKKAIGEYGQGFGLA
jgi:hypothetical protein